MAASAVGLPSDRTPGQGAWNTPCTPRRRRHAAKSSRTASHARAWASPPAREYWCCGGGITAYHTADTRGMEASSVRVPGRGEGPVAPEEAPDGAALGDTHPMAKRGGLCGGGVLCRQGGQGHGPPEWRHPVGPGGWVAPGLCAAPEIPAQGGRGARPRAKPAGSPAVPCRGSRGGGGAGWRGRRGGRLAEEVLVVFVGVEFQAQIEVARPRLGTVALPRLVPRGCLLHGEEGPQGTPAGALRRAAGGCSSGTVPGRSRAGPGPPLGQHPARMAGRRRGGPRPGTPRVPRGPARTRGRHGPLARRAVLPPSTRTRPWHSAARCPRLRRGGTYACTPATRVPGPHQVRPPGGRWEHRPIRHSPQVTRRQGSTLGGWPGLRGHGPQEPRPRDSHVPSCALGLHDHVLVPHQPPMRGAASLVVDGGPQGIAPVHGIAPGLQQGAHGPEAGHGRR